MSSDADSTKSILVPHTFNNDVLLEIEYGHRPVFLAHQIGKALGYTNPSKVAENIRKRWAEDFEEGRDFVRLDGDALAHFKAAVNNAGEESNSFEMMLPPDRGLHDIKPNAPHLILLTESGAQLVAILSRTPQGRAFRRWLLDVVLPAYRDRHAPPPPALPVPAAPMADRMTRFELGCEILKGVILHHRYDRAAVATRALALVDMMLSPPNQQLPNLHAMTRGLLDLLEDLYLRKALDRGRLVEYKLRITDRIAATGWSDAPRARTEADDALREDFAAVQRLMARLARRKLLEDGKEQALCLYVVDRLAAGEQVTFGDLTLANEVLNWLTWLNTWGVINRTIYRDRVQRLLDVLLPEQTALVRGGAP